MTDLWYEERGDGTPVVLLHQGVVDSRIWDPFLPFVRGLRTIRYDQRGFGRSPLPGGPYSVVSDLVSVMDAVGIERASLVAVSQGGGIAMTAALDRPERISALILVGSGLPGHPLRVKWTPEQIARWDRAEEATDYAAMAELDMEAWAPLGADDRLRRLFVENAEGSNMEHAVTDEPVAGRVGLISAPTLVITAARDVPAINEVGELIANEIPGAQRAVIEEADHMIQWRAPQELAQHVLRFLT